MITTTTPPETAAFTGTTRRTGTFVGAWVIAHRTVLKFMRTPALIVVATVQGAMFLLIFRYVFGGAIGIAGMRYVDYLVPGYVATGVLFSGMGASAGVAEDMEQGFVDRLRSLPINRASVLIGRALADTALLAWGTFVTTAIGFAVGFRLHGGIGKGVLAFVLCIVFGFAFEWIFVLIGMLAGSAQAAQGMSLLVFPFTFVSSAFVPVNSMPGWLQPVARNQPLTPMVNAVRTLTQGHAAEQFLGHSASYWVIRSLIWSLVLAVVFGMLAVARFRKG
ncbi:MAG: type transporter [Acidimicrobiia bacterium]|nr:type transporter [Acidimicrobiia bacterium]